MNQPMSACATIVLAALLLAACDASVEVDSEEEATTMASAEDLKGTAWWVEDIANHGVVDRSHTTIHFHEPGRVAGDTSCNRYRGPVEIEGEKLSFGPLAGTLKACSEALMNQEQAFYRALERASRWEIAETGLLHLHDADGEQVIRAARIDPEEA